MSKYTATLTYPWIDALENYRTLAEKAGHAPSDGWNQVRKLALVESVVRAYTPYQDSSVPLLIRSRRWSDIIPHQLMQWLHRFLFKRDMWTCLLRPHQRCHTASMLL